MYEASFFYEERGKVVSGTSTYWLMKKTKEEDRVGGMGGRGHRCNAMMEERSIQEPFLF